jgi:hypothetical protein
MTKLRARGALRREAAGEGADFVAAADVDDRALRLTARPIECSEIHIAAAD